MEVHSCRPTGSHEPTQTEGVIRFGCLKENTSPELRPRALRRGSLLLLLESLGFQFVGFGFVHSSQTGQGLRQVPLRVHAARDESDSFGELDNRFLEFTLF